MLRVVANVVGALVEEASPQIGLDQVHLVDEAEYLGCWRVLGQSSEDVCVVQDVCDEFSRFDVEDEDQHGYGGEDVLSLVRQVVFDKAVLSANVLAVGFKTWFIVEGIHVHSQF